MEDNLFRSVHKLMGNRFEITVACKDENRAQECTDAVVMEIKRIETLLTTFQETSQTNQINANAGVGPVIVDKEVVALIVRSLKISSLTQGAFDITYGSIDKRLWNFDQQMTELPDKELAKKMVKLINYRNIIVNEDNNTVLLKEKGMRIGFGGIGKGYAADRGKWVLKNMGVENGVVNAAGDLITIGYQPDGSPWTVGIADPNAKNHPFSYLNISNMAVATSGNYEKFVMIGGRKYSHTIDPRTGMPVSGIKSVTVICKSAELADALATPIMVMGIGAGLHMVNQMKGVACIIIDDQDHLFTSNNMRLR